MLQPEYQNNHRPGDLPDTIINNRNDNDNDDDDDDNITNDRTRRPTNTNDFARTRQRTHSTPPFRNTTSPDITPDQPLNNLSPALSDIMYSLSPANTTRQRINSTPPSRNTTSPDITTDQPINNLSPALSDLMGSTSPIDDLFPPLPSSSPSPSLPTFASTNPILDDHNDQARRTEVSMQELYTRRRQRNEEEEMLRRRLLEIERRLLDIERQNQEDDDEEERLVSVYSESVPHQQFQVFQETHGPTRDNYLDTLIRFRRRRTQLRTNRDYDPFLRQI
ncbi:hypothetical protein [Absidia glauca]|uniref:Uncharacterized protein n=1 Tax=Absidia glauca TaxID=4829 RepID=A0A168LJR8_ABSGL|nr:hypothetical protein [Absidia glauca]